MAISVPMIYFLVAILANQPSRISFSCRQHLAISLTVICLIVANLATRVPPKCIYFRQRGVEFIFSSPIWRYIATILSTACDPPTLQESKLLG
jgi:hypothetical protein